MSLTAVVPIRFDSETDARLGRVSQRSGLTKADLIRRATEDFLNQIERTGEIKISIHATRGAQVATHGGRIQNHLVNEKTAVYLPVRKKAAQKSERASS